MSLNGRGDRSGPAVCETMASWRAPAALWSRTAWRERRHPLLAGLPHQRVWCRPKTRPLKSCGTRHLGCQPVEWMPVRLRAPLALQREQQTSKPELPPALRLALVLSTRPWALQEFLPERPHLPWEPPARRQAVFQKARRRNPMPGPFLPAQQRAARTAWLPLQGIRPARRELSLAPLPSRGRSASTRSLRPCSWPHRRSAWQP